MEAAGLPMSLAIAAEEAAAVDVDSLPDPNAPTSQYEAFYSDQPTDEASSSDSEAQVSETPATSALSELAEAAESKYVLPPPVEEPAEPENHDHGRDQPGTGCHVGRRRQHRERADGAG